MKPGFMEEGISDQEFARRLMADYDKAFDGASFKNVKENPEQMKKFRELLLFLKQAADESDGRISEVELDPGALTGGITVDMEVFCVSAEGVQKFCKLLSACSAVSVDITSDDKVSISCTMPNVFVPA